MTGGILANHAIIFRCAPCETAGSMPSHLAEGRVPADVEGGGDTDPVHPVEAMANALDMLAKAYTAIARELLDMAEQQDDVRTMVLRLVAHMEAQDGRGRHD